MICQLYIQSQTQVINKSQPVLLLRDDLHWWERLSEDAWEAVEAITAWLETEGNFFNKRDLK